MIADPPSPALADPYRLPTPARGRRAPWWLLALLLALIAGAVAAGIAIERSKRLAALLHLVPESAVAQAAAAPAPPAEPVVDTMTQERLAALEETVAVLDQRTIAATGNADRAEGLLIAFAARRALDRGVSLGYIEGLLRDRFGGIDPQSVAAVIAAAHQPVTLDQLQTELEAVRPKLVAVEAADGWWDSLKHELAGLIIIRRADTPSTIPADRVLRAQRMLDEGQVDRAMAEIARLPARAAAAGWLGEARRYVGARNALDRIETAALLRPQAPTPPPPAPAAPAAALPLPAAAAD